jgi:hypothetical protein
MKKNQKIKAAEYFGVHALTVAHAIQLVVLRPPQTVLLAAGSRGNCQSTHFIPKYSKADINTNNLDFWVPFLWTNEERTKRTQLCFLNFYSKHVQMDLGVKKLSDFNDFPER